MYLCLEYRPDGSLYDYVIFHEQSDVINFLVEAMAEGISFVIKSI